MYANCIMARRLARLTCSQHKHVFHYLIDLSFVLFNVLFTMQIH